MTEPLYHLVYYSRNKIGPGEGQFESEVSEILDASRRNNPTRQITGALLFNSGCFAQVLEGPLDAIEQTFERIQQDVRHGDVSLLAVEPISERTFPNWAMGFLGNSALNADRFAGIGSASGFDPDRLDGHQIYSILKDLAMAEESQHA